MDLDPHQVVMTKLTEEGVLGIELGHVAALRFREVGKALVALLDGAALDTYRRIKHPDGMGSATVEARKAAWKWLLEHASELAAGQWYLRLE